MFSPSQLASVGSSEAARETLRAQQLATRWEAEAAKATQPSVQRRLAIRAKAARMFGRQRALRQRIVATGAALAAVDADAPLRVTAPGVSSSNVAMGMMTRHDPIAADTRVTSAALLARSDGIIGAPEEGRSADGIVWRVRRRPPHTVASFNAELRLRRDAEQSKRVARHAVRAVVAALWRYCGVEVDGCARVLRSRPRLSCAVLGRGWFGAGVLESYSGAFS